MAGTHEQPKSVQVNLVQSKPAINGFLTSLQQGGTLPPEVASQIGTIKTIIAEFGKGSLIGFPRETTLSVESQTSENAFLISPVVLLRVIADTAQRFIDQETGRINYDGSRRSLPLEDRHVEEIRQVAAALQELPAITAEIVNFDGARNPDGTDRRRQLRFPSTKRFE